LTQKANFPGNARNGAIGFSIGSKGYLGMASNYNPDDLYEYDPNSNTWTYKAAFPGSERAFGVGFSV
jgi:N-acetylneuraminic acid mutarotase